MSSGWVRPLVAISLLLLLAACSMPRTRDPGYHHVRPGDTLYSIAFSYGLDFRDIARWNGIPAPFRIYAGQRLSLIPPDKQRLEPLAYYSKPVEDKSVGAWTPEQRRTRPAVPAPAASAAPSTPKPAVAKPVPTLRTAAKPVSAPRPAARPAPAPAQTAKIEKTNPRPQSQTRRSPSRWRWPTEGEMVTPFSLPQGKKGIDIRGKVGQAVVATADGEVVYSGKGLMGYGNLVIIKHSDAYLSAYGHNRRLLVQEGQNVTQGQKIAEMGQTPKVGSILHFEIRKNGKPVDPTRFLPTTR